jgi:hypothetical protein
MLKQDPTFSNYFTVSKFLMRRMGLMLSYQLPNVRSKVTSIENKGTTRLERLTYRPQRVVQLSLGSTALASLKSASTKG